MFSLKKMFGGKDDKKVILAPVEGKAVSLKEVNDPTFSPVSYTHLTLPTT